MLTFNVDLYNYRFVVRKKNMFKTLFWIYLISIFALALTKANYAKLSEKEKQDMMQRWEDCCKANTCIHNSCYTVQWMSSTWPAARQRCQSQYSEWPYAVDIFRIQSESDLRIFWTMLQKPPVHIRETPEHVWTSGLVCPKYWGSKAEPRWISSNQPFPEWLKERTKKAFSSHRNFCEFLAISPSPNTADVKYNFQDQNARYSSICEFTFPNATWIEITTQPSTNKTTSITVTPKIKEPVSNTTLQMTKETSTTDNRVTPFSASGIEPAATLATPLKWQTNDYTIPVASTKAPGYCEERNTRGIYWPKTPAGEIARRQCPKGMIGIAEWVCDKRTLRFRPEKPLIEGCKHEWIDHIEDSLLKRDDAVEISTRLARETKHNNMSHGDIIALVNITARLFNLYVEQKQEEEFEVMQNEELPIYYNFTKTIISSISNILREEIKDAWEDLNENRQTKEASTILKLVTTIGSRLSCMKTSSRKLQFTVSEENIDLQTFILNNTNSNDETVRFPQETKNVETDSFITLPAHLKLEKWFSPCKSYTSAVGVVYKHVGDFLKAGQQESTTTTVATKVLSFSLSNSTESISLSEGKVSITLQHLKENGAQGQVLKNPRCVFWNFSKSDFGEWDSSGCRLLSFNRTHTVCECDHLTNFAVLMDINDNISDDDILTWMTYVCCGFSSVSLVLTLICFLSIRSLHGRRSIITGNLSFTLLVSNALIIFGLDKTEDKIVCAVVAGILHYWILSAFCWMLVEGYHLYRMVILVFQRGSNLPVKFYYLFAYGAPLIVVGISVIVRKEGYGGSKYCWLSADDKGLIWSFVGPACAIILINIVIFILTLRSASSVKIKREQPTAKKIKSWIRGSISVMCLLGLTWCIGLLYINRKLHFFSYIFTILNGLQGVFIFLFHIILNEKVSSFFSCKQKTMFGGKKFLNYTSSNQTNSKTSTRTSMNSLGCTSSTRLADSKNMNNNHISVVRNAVTSNGISDAGKKNFKKNKLTHAVSSNGLRPQPSLYDANVRIRSASTSDPVLSCKHPYVSKKPSVTS